MIVLVGARIVKSDELVSACGWSRAWVSTEEVEELYRIFYGVLGAVIKMTMQGKVYGACVKRNWKCLLPTDTDLHVTISLSSVANYRYATNQLRFHSPACLAR